MAEHRADSEPPCAGPDASQQEPESTTADDWSQTTDRKAKKRMQNRVAQRSYRQRMKARVEELQAKVEQLEGSKHGVQAMDSSAHSLSMNGPDRCSPNALFAPSRRDSHLDSNFHSGAPTATMLRGSPPHAVRDAHAIIRPQSMQSRSQSVHDMSTFSLLNTSPVPSTMAPDMTTNMAMTNLHLQPTPFAAPNHCFDYFGEVPSAHNQQSNNFMDTVSFQDTQAMTSTAMSSASRPDSPPSGSSLTSDFMPSMSGGINSPDDSYRSSSLASTEIPPTLCQLGNNASVEERLKYVAEQAKLAGFSDLDAMITAYYTVMAADPSGLGDGEGNAARRLPRLIATLRHAVQEWRDWERKGFPLD